MFLRRRLTLNKQKILSVVKHNPGINTPRIAEVLEMSWTSCNNHLMELRSRGLVDFEHTGKSVGRCWYMQHATNT